MVRAVGLTPQLRCFHAGLQGLHLPYGSGIFPFESLSYETIDAPTRGHLLLVRAVGLTPQLRCFHAGLQGLHLPYGSGPLSFESHQLKK